VNKWLRRIRAALLMGLTWAVVWMPVGLLIGMIMDPTGSMDEPWVLVGTLPGFLAGIMFSVVLGIAARRRRLHELSVARVGGWGAVAGFLIGSIPMILGDQDGRNVEHLWLLPLVVISSITVLSAASAAGSLVLARRSETRELPDPQPRASSLGSESDTHALRGGGR
jgi:hypothetical protein